MALALHIHVFLGMGISGESIDFYWTLRVQYFFGSYFLLFLRWNRKFQRGRLNFAFIHGFTGLIMGLLGLFVDEGAKDLSYLTFVLKRASFSFVNL